MLFKAGLLISNTSSTSLSLDVMGLMEGMLFIPRDCPRDVSRDVPSLCQHKVNSRKFIHVRIDSSQPACVSPASPKHGPYSSQSASGTNFCCSPSADE